MKRSAARYVLPFILGGGARRVRCLGRGMRFETHVGNTPPPFFRMCSLLYGFFTSARGAQIPRKMRFQTPKKWHFASEVGSEGRNLPRGGGFCSPHVPSRSQRHKLREYGTKEARKRLFSNLYLNTFPASTANPLGAARPTHFFWRALRSSTRRGDFQRWWFPLSGAGGRSG